LRGVQTKEEASDAINSRILALSRAHNILTEQNWDGSDLRMMVDSSMEAFRYPGRQAISFDGPRLRVGPHAALSIALALHELATNAVKYGALSNSTGTVTVEWTVSSENRFTLKWTERGGPKVRQTDRKGFGSRLILRVLPKELQGTAEMDFAEDGLKFKLETSMEAIVDSSASVGL